MKIELTHIQIMPGCRTIGGTEQAVDIYIELRVGDNKASTRRRGVPISLFSAVKKDLCNELATRIVGDMSKRIEALL